MKYGGLKLRLLPETSDCKIATFVNVKLGRALTANELPILLVFLPLSFSQKDTDDSLPQLWFIYLSVYLTAYLVSLFLFLSDLSNQVSITSLLDL